MPSPSRSRPVRLLGLGVMSLSPGRPAAGLAGSSPVGPGCGWSLTTSSPRFLCGEASRVRGVPCLHPQALRHCLRCRKCVALRRPWHCGVVARIWSAWLPSTRQCELPGCDVLPSRRGSGEAAPLRVWVRESLSCPARGRWRRWRCAPGRGCGFFVAGSRSSSRPSCLPVADWSSGLWRAWSLRPPPRRLRRCRLIPPPPLFVLVSPCGTSPRRAGPRTFRGWWPGSPSSMTSREPPSVPDRRLRFLRRENRCGGRSSRRACGAACRAFTLRWTDT